MAISFWRGLVVAAAVAIGVAGVAAATDYVYDESGSPYTVNASGWGSLDTVTIQPVDDPGDAVSVTVTEGSATSMGSLLLDANNANSGGGELPHNVSLDFTGSAGEVNVGFSDATLTGYGSMPDTSATLSITGNATNAIAVQVTGSTFLNGNANLNLYGGVAGASFSTSTLTLTGATSNAVTVGGTNALLELTGASTIINGTLTVTANGTVSLDQLTVDTANGIIALAGGTIAFVDADSVLALTNDGTMRVTAASAITGDGTVNNASGDLDITANLAARDASFVSAGQTRVRNGALLEVASFSVAAGQTRVQNGATLKADDFTMSGDPAALVTVGGNGARLELTGATIEQGTLRVNPYGTVSLDQLAVNTADGIIVLAGGTIAFVDADSELALTDGTMRVTADSTITGDGTVNNISGTLNINANLDATDASFNSAGTTTVRNSAILDVATFSVSGGQTTVRDSATLAADNFSVSGGQTTVQDSAILEAENFTMSGDPDALITVGGTNARLRLTGAAASTIEDGALRVNAGGTVALGQPTQLTVDSADGIIQLAGGMIDFADSSSVLALTNDGTMQVTAASTIIGSGTVRNTSGTLDIAANLTAPNASFDSAGTTTVRNNATLEALLFKVTGGQTAVQSGSQLIAGSYEQTGGSITVNGTLTAPIFNLSGGNVIVGNNGVLALTGATIDNGTLSVNSGGTISLGQLTVDTNGIIVLNGGKIAFADASSELALTSGGTMTVTAASTITGDGTVNNISGTLNINASLDATDASFDSASTTTVRNSAILAAENFSISGGQTTVRDSAILEAENFIMSGDPAALITVGGTNARLRLTGAAASTIEDGVLRVNNGGTVALGQFNQSTQLIVDSADGIIELAGGTIAFVNAGSELTLTGGGRMTVTAASTITGSGTVRNTSGTIDIEANLTATNASFVSNGTTIVRNNATLAAKNFRVIGGQTTVQNGATLTAADFSVTGGIATVDYGGLLAVANQLAVSGGQLNVNGSLSSDPGILPHAPGVTADTVAVSGNGNVNIGLSGLLIAGTYEQSGGTTTIDGVLSAPIFNLSGGDVIVSDFGLLDVSGIDLSTIDDYLNPDEEYTGTLNVSGGKLTLAGMALAGDMTFSGGIVQVDSAGLLYVQNNVGGARGTLIMNGGEAFFDNGISFDAGGITSTALGGNIIGDVGIRQNATLDVSEGSITIIGELALSGAYKAGINSSGNTRANVNRLIVQDSADIILTDALIKSIIGGGDNRILASTTASGTLALGFMFEDDYIYRILVEDTGLYVANVRPTTMPGFIGYMWDEWNRHPDVDGNADKLIDNDFASVVLRASLDYMDQTLYPFLTYDGRQNILNLFAIGEGPSAASYSGLMLYNGSGLAAVNQANLDAARQALGALERRAESLRHEIAADPAGATAPGRDYYGYESYPNRFWVDLYGSRLREDWDQGFAGYIYEPRGFALGYDRIFDRFAVGAAFNYGYGRFQDRAAERNDSSIASYNLSVYGLYASESGLYAAGSLGYTYYDNAVHDLRTLGYDGNGRGWNRADYNAYGWQLAGGVGYDIEVLDYFNLTPSVGIRHLTARGEAHDQKFSPDGGLEYTTLRVGEIRGRSTTLPVELAASYDIFGEKDSVLSLSGMVGYAYELNGNGARGSFGYGGLAYPRVKIVNRSTGRSIFTTGLGFDYIHDRYQFGLDYKYTARSEYSAHDLNGTFSLMF